MKQSSYSRTMLAALALGAFLAPSGAHARDAFTIAVISDTQNYVDNNKPQPGSLRVFAQETRYLAEHARAMELAFVTHVGDVVQHGDGTNGSPGDASYGAGLEWIRATEAMDILSASRVPFGMSPGNHDYDNYSYLPANGNRPLKSDVVWRNYFGSDSPYFAGKSWYGDASNNLAYNPGLSSYQAFAAGGRNFLHISLELEAGDAALAWAQGVIDSHKAYATIVTTHEYLDPPADNDDSLPLEVPAQRIAAGYLTTSPGGWNGGQELWAKLIAKNDQIFMVICGHASGPAVNGVSKSENIRIDNNEAGHPVYQVLTDFQNNTIASSGGDGWLRFMEFDMKRNTIHFSTYSPTLNKRAGLNGEHTFNQAPEFSDFTLPIPAQVFDAPRAPRAPCRPAFEIGQAWGGGRQEAVQ